MSADETRLPEEDEVASLLAAYDDALATGSRLDVLLPGPPADGSPGPQLLWPPSRGGQSNHSIPDQGTVNAVDYSPDGRMVLTGSYDWTVRLWETATGRPIGPPLLHDGTVADAVFSPDGRLVVTGSFDRTVRIWRVPPPVAGAPELIRDWVEVITGLELDEEAVIRFLDAPAWQQRRQRLQELGGPPLP